MKERQDDWPEDWQAIAGGILGVSKEELEEIDTFEVIGTVWPPVYRLSDGVYDPSKARRDDPDFPSEIDVE